MLPDQWQNLLELLAVPVSWIPGMQRAMFATLFTNTSGWVSAVTYTLLLFPVLLWFAAVWCTQLSIYTIPLRSGRVEFVKKMLLAWWDAALAVWMFWVGLGRFLTVVVGWVFALCRLALRLGAEFFRQLVLMPFSMTGRMTQSYFQPGLPWVAFMLLVFWCLLEALIFSFTLYPTVSEMLASIVGGVAPALVTRVILYMFLFLLIMGSFACVQVLADSMKQRQYKYFVQMVLVEFFVMAFEVMFLYRELVDAITPWIAQQTGGEHLGVVFTLSLATFGWIGIRGMTWFLFGQFGTPPLLAIISRRPMVMTEPEGKPIGVQPAQLNWWNPPLEDFKQELAWLHHKATELLEYLTLPFVHVAAAALNFAMILVTSRPVFAIPFENLHQALKMREKLADMRLRPKKAESP